MTLPTTGAGGVESIAKSLTGREASSHSGKVPVWSWSGGWDSAFQVSGAKYRSLRRRLRFIWIKQMVIGHGGGLLFLCQHCLINLLTSGRRMTSVEIAPVAELVDRFLSGAPIRSLHDAFKAKAWNWKSLVVLIDRHRAVVDRQRPSKADGLYVLAVKSLAVDQHREGVIWHAELACTPPLSPNRRSNLGN